MKRIVKKIIKKMLPERWFSQIISVTARNYQHRFLEQNGLDTITGRMIEKYGLSILHGPFKGMTYPKKSLISRHGAPKLLGSYEKELHHILIEAVSRAEQYESFIDIGCAEGYYAVGLAFATGKVVDAFDPELRERSFCLEMAKLNGVETQIVLHKWCSADYLRGLDGKRSFILSDCEGYEENLFVASSIPSLSRCDLLIELHDFDGKNMHEALSKRFSRTHEIQTISARTPDATEYEELEFLGDDAVKAISEYRNAGQKWIFCKAMI